MATTWDKIQAVPSLSNFRDASHISRNISHNFAGSMTHEVTNTVYVHRANVKKIGQDVGLDRSDVMITIFTCTCNATRQSGEDCICNSVMHSWIDMEKSTEQDWNMCSRRYCASSDELNEQSLMDSQQKHRCHS